MPRTVKGLVLFLDGVPDCKGEFFAKHALKNIGKAVPLRDQYDRDIGTAVTNKGDDGNVHVVATIDDDSFSIEAPAYVSVGAQVFDCDHHFEGGVSTQIRANDADLTHVTIGPANPDERVPPVEVPAPPPPEKAVHDGAGTEPEE
jgi:hypothetical protein